MMKWIACLIGVLGLLLGGCSSPGALSYDEYMMWLNTPENGMKQTRKVNGVELQVKHLPKDYLVYNELNGELASNASVDSLKTGYGKTLTFLLTLGPDQDKFENADIMKGWSGSLEDYKSRLVDLKFGLKERINLRTEQGIFSPVLVHFEDHYGLRPSRDVTIVFAPEEGKEIAFTQSGFYRFEYDDRLFGMGKVQFNFKKDNLDNIPQLLMNNSKKS